MSETRRPGKISPTVKRFGGTVLITAMIVTCQLVRGVHTMLLFIMVLVPLVMALMVAAYALPERNAEEKEQNEKTLLKIGQLMLVSAIVLTYAILVLPPVFEWGLSRIDQLSEQAKQDQPAK